MEKIKLNKLEAIGLIDENTPIIVIEEIASSHQIGFERSALESERYVRKVIEAIEKTQTIVVSETNWTFAELKQIATFVNSNVKSWTRSSLIEAFMFISEFNRYSFEAIQNLILGYPTPEHPQTLSPSLLYSICRKLELKVNRHSTIEELFNKIKLNHANRDALLNRIEAELRYLNKSELVEIVYNLPRKKFTETTIDFEQLEEISGNLSNNKNLLKLVKPRTNEEAVILAAMVYGLDISRSKVPILEFFHMNDSNYRPVDSNLKRKEIQLSHNFNPRLPQRVYSREMLINLLIEEGYLSGEIHQSSIFSTLQLNALSNTFYHGKLPKITNRETPFLLEPIDELEDNDVICYGVKDEVLIAFTYEELAGFFKNQRNFNAPPSGREPLEIRTIRKLKNLCSSNRFGRNQEQKLITQELINILIGIEVLEQLNDQKCKAFIELYRELDSTSQQLTREALQILLEIGMILRGWMGGEPFPIEISLFDDKRLELIEIKFATTLPIFREKCFKLGHIGLALLDLPIFKFVGGKFSISTNPSDGSSLNQRLDIIATGNLTNDTKSCIRLSSNWICASAYYYMTLVGIDPGFSIQRLTWIS